MDQKNLSSSNSNTIDGLLSQDYIVGVIYDKIKDVYLMINYQQRGGLWFPYSERRINETSYQTIKRLIDPIIIHDSEQIQLVKVCSTKTLPFKGHDVLFYAIIPKSTTIINIWLNGKIDGIDFERQINILQNNAIVWLTTIQLKHISKLSRLLGMEPLSLNKQFKDIFHSTIKSNNINTSVIFEEVKIPQIETISKTSHNNSAEILLISAKFTSTIQEKLYEEYHNAVLPSDYLNLETFKELILRKGLDSQHIIDYFRAFDSTQRNYLTFLDYLLGLAALDPNTQHGGVPAEQRCRYIFRYYNINNNQRMTFDEFKLMIKDIHKNKGENLSNNILNDEALQMFRSFGLRSSDQTLSLMDFLSGVGQLRFRGTSVLFRLNMPISEFFQRSSLSLTPNTLIIPSSTSNTITSHRTLNTKTMTRRSGTQQQLSNISIDESHPYEIATHIIKVKKTGVVVNITSLYDLDVAGAISGSTALFFDDDNGKFDRINSQNCFNQRTHANEMLHGLRYFERGAKEGGPALKDPFSWGKVDMAGMARCLLVLCKQVYSIFIKEDRLLRLTSACYILGDLHGNFRDLLCFEKTFWRLGPVLTPASLLFLGDYVDRGQEGIEVVAYLFAQKVLCPHKVYLLRGNHELRNVQDMFQFHGECRRKFGIDLGEQVWEEINRCFDAMPICALVDNRILCVHGGIPSLDNKNDFFKLVSQIPCPLRDPENESPLAWELLWNDPLSNDIRDLDNTNNEFILNVRRGTGFFFSSKALNDFLYQNSLSYVVRAHEVQQQGFKVQLNGRLLTVFSSSHYCGGENEAATVLCDSNKLRLIRLDTSS
ncbi:unnamed protein product [Rotaria sordida]|uniref:Serine/threonine-protein phosphatase n=1 Tax=Rotaria sordida TaxID=392033 RepID=A0A813X0A2_9BILA|nr:unnamed protein product [Rotaria sordida]CAF3549477.1 unnamed protein product [Rotaria sordida]